MFPAESFSSMKFCTGADIQSTFFLQSLSLYIYISIFVVTVKRVASVSSVRLRKISQSCTRDYINREEREREEEKPRAREDEFVKDVRVNVRMFLLMILQMFPLPVISSPSLI